MLNDPRVVSFPTETHVPVAAIGPSRYLDTPLYHLDTLLNSRQAREAKAERYERLHPGKRVAGRPMNQRSTCRSWSIRRRPRCPGRICC